MQMKIKFTFHRPQFFDVQNLHDLKAFTLSLQPAALVGALAFGVLARGGVLVAFGGALLAFVGTVMVTGLIALLLSDRFARGAMSFVAPSGRSTPSTDDYSFEKALLARGKVDEALTSLEVRLANHPDDAALCLFVADVYAREGREPAKAERLYLRAREMVGASPEHDYRATNRLIDLYMGALDDPARAEAELERMRLRHAGTTAAAHAEQALRTLKNR
jgi:hypothetical protein